MQTCAACTNFNERIDDLASTENAERLVNERFVHSMKV
jgi:hypothetical protein